LVTPVAADRDGFGGCDAVRGKTTSFFHTERIAGKWWLITPEGNAFLSKGVNHVSFRGDHSPALGYAPYGRAVQARYGSASKWAEATAARMREWGLNTVGAWSSAEMFEQRMPYTLILGLADSAGANWQRGEVADVFSTQFKQAVRRQARRLCAPRAQDPFLLGYFSDNELRWGADWRSQESLFEEFLGQPDDSPGRQVLIRQLRGRYATVEAFNQAWGTQLKTLDELASLKSLPMTSEAAKQAERQFIGEYAHAYFRTCYDAIRAVDPNHLILGCRYAGYFLPETVAAMSGFVDVVSFNNYGFSPPAERLRELHRITGKPVMLTEFSFKAMDSGLPNTKGAGKPVATQQERADYFDQYVTTLVRMPFIVGYHWFEYADEPAEGRFDGENSNYGLVNGQDDPWATLVQRVNRVNARLEQVHLEGDIPPPKAKEAGWRTLINGKDLSGWLTHVWEDAPTWTVANGVLQSTGGKGYLRTKESFRDFELALEARVYDRDGGRGNSGVYIRSQPHADQGAEYPPAYEVQIDHGDDNNPTGSIYNRHQAIATNLKDGEWFRMRIRAVGSHIQVWINDQSVLDVQDTTFADGYIFLQQHHKTGVCEFRDIRIRGL
jgi:agarase